MEKMIGTMAMAINIAILPRSFCLNALNMDYCPIFARQFDIADKDSARRIAIRLRPMVNKTKNFVDYREGSG